MRHATTQKVFSLKGTIEAFLLNRRVGNCTSETLKTYQAHLYRFLKAVSDGVPTPLTVQGYLNNLGASMQPISKHKHYRSLSAFLNWCVTAGILAENPLAGFKMKLPRTLPHTPTAEHIRLLLRACGDDWGGRRAKALVSLLADSGLRISEALHLRIEDIHFVERTITIISGKGQKDGTGNFGAETALALKNWLTVRTDAQPEDFLFVDVHGRALHRDYATHLMHKLSRKAGIAAKDEHGKWHGLIGCHAMRHFAATQILKATGDLELVRRVLRHETLNMSLKYAVISNVDVSRKFRRASPLDNLRLA